MSKLLITKEWIEANRDLVQVKKSSSYPELMVLKYKKKVFFKNLWTPELLQCRGLVLDNDYNCVVRPFDKIFNYGENGTTFKRDDLCVYSRKVNGYMGAVTNTHEHGVIYSTTGTLDSDYAKMIEKHVPKHVAEKFDKGNTLLFEICDVSDPHIIKEDEGAYLIGVVDCNTGWHFSEECVSRVALKHRLKRYVHEYARFSDIVKMSKECKYEGYVVRLQEDPTKFLKIKSPYYLTTKFLARKNIDKITNMLDNIEQTKKTIDEEYYPLLDFLSGIKETFIQQNEQERIEVIRNYFAHYEVVEEGFTEQQTGSVSWEGSE